mgnify:CR=1 FL=1
MSTASPRTKTQDWLLELDAAAAGQASARDRGAFARRQRRGNAAEFDHGHQGFRRRRISSCRKRKSGVEWLDADTLLLSSALGEGMATTSGYARTVRLWRRGEPVERAPVLFERAGRPDGRVLQRRRHRRRRRGCGSSIGSISSISNLWLGDRGRSRAAKLDLPTDIWLQAHQRLAGRQTAYAPGRWRARPMRRTACSASRCRPFWPATATSPLSSSQGRGGRCRAFSGPPASLCCLILDELRPVFEICTPSAKRLDAREVAGTARNRRGRCLASRPSRSREQRRPARQCAGSADAAVADADRRRRQPRRVEAGAEDLFARTDSSVTRP